MRELDSVSRVTFWGSNGGTQSLLLVTAYEYNVQVRVIRQIKWRRKCSAEWEQFCAVKVL